MTFGMFWFYFGSLSHCPQGQVSPKDAASQAGPPVQCGQLLGTLADQPGVSPWYFRGAAQYFEYPIEMQTLSHRL